MDTTDLTGQLREQLERERSLIACAYLYGSRATDQARDDSDVDLAVLFRDPKEPALVCPAARLAQRLEQAIKRSIARTQSSWALTPRGAAALTNVLSSEQSSRPWL